MPSPVVLYIAMAATVTSAYQHDFSSTMYGHSKKDMESAWKDTRQVHPHYDPHKHEKPLITTCCDFRANSTQVETELPAESKRIQQKCYGEIKQLFLDSGKKTTREGDNNTLPLIFSLDRNMSICLYQCFSRELNVSNEAGNIVLHKAFNVTLVHERRILGVTERMVEKCVNRANKLGPITTREKSYLCNMATVEYEQCILEHMDLLCPVYNQIKAEICDKYREKLRRKYVIK